MISDVIVPGTTRRQFLGALRRDFPKLPVLLMSGYTPDWPTLDDPLARFLAKPYTTRQLIEAAAALVETAQT